MSTKILKAFLVFAVLCWFAGCGYREGVLIKEPVSYLYFTGNTENAFVSIDDKEGFSLSKATLSQDAGGGQAGKPTYYQVPPGKHRIAVRIGGELVVDRVLIIGNGTTQEIRIP